MVSLGYTRNYTADRAGFILDCSMHSLISQAK